MNLVVSNITKKTVLLIIFTLFFAPSFANAADYYFTDAVDSDWGNTNNWFSDVGFTIPAGGTPGASDDAYIYADVDTSRVSSVSVHGLNVMSGTITGTASFTVTTGINFRGSSINNKDYFAPNIHFYDTSSNNTTINLVAEFLDSSVNNVGASVLSTTYFRNNSQNGGTVDWGNAYFFDNSANLASAWVSQADFRDHSTNASNSSGNFSGGVSFYDYSEHTGHASGNAFFGCTAQNNGTVDGTISYDNCDVYFYAGNTSSDWDTLTSWWLTKGVDRSFSDQVVRLPTSNDHVYIYDSVYSGSGAKTVNSLEAFDSSNVDLGLNLASYAIFNDSSSFTDHTISVVGGSITFNDSSSVSSAVLIGDSLSMEENSSLDEGISAVTMVGVTTKDLGCHTNINEGNGWSGAVMHPCVSSPLNGTFGTGSTIPIYVNFNENPDFLVYTNSGEVPTLTLDTGSGTTEVPCSNCDTATSTWVFNYTVQAGDSSSDLDYEDSSALDTTGFTINFNAFSTGSLAALPNPVDNDSLSAENDIVINTTPPVISSVSSSTTATTATISWTTDEAASSSVHFGTTTSYGTVSTSSGITTHTVNLTGLSGSTLYHFSVYAFDLLNNLATTTDYTFTTGVLDSSAPALVSFTTASPDGTYSSGQTITVRATFDENVTSTSTLTLLLNSGGSVTLSSVSGNVISGTYTVSSSDSASDLTVSSIISASVADSLYNTSTSYSVPSAPNNLGDSANIVVHTVSSGGGGGGGGITTSTKPKQKDTPTTPALPVSAPNNPDNPNNPNYAPVSCEPYLTEYIEYGKTNSKTEVEKLQNFLNTYEGEKLSVTGVYDTQTFEAVKRFQSKEASVLSFWGLSKPTGRVYVSTVNRINTIVCTAKNSFACPFFTSNDYANLGAKGEGVFKIKQFLNFVAGEKLSFAEVKSENVYDNAVMDAVKRFQAKYSEKILSPWGAKTPTGRWFESTTKAANDALGCFLEVRLSNGKVLQ